MRAPANDRRRSTFSEAEHLVSVYTDLLTHCDERIAEATTTNDGNALAYLLQRKARYLERLAALQTTLSGRVPT